MIGHRGLRTLARHSGVRDWVQVALWALLAIMNLPTRANLDRRGVTATVVFLSVSAFWAAAKTVLMLRGARSRGSGGNPSRGANEGS